MVKDKEQVILCNVPIVFTSGFYVLSQIHGSTIVRRSVHRVREALKTCYQPYKSSHDLSPFFLLTRMIPTINSRKVTHLEITPP